MKRSYAAEAQAYAESVLSGEITACKWVQLACKRFMDDLARDDLEWRPEAAQKAVNFIQTLPHTKGRWASKKELLLLAPWQIFIVCCIFGFYQGERRRFQVVFLLIARKNGKSALAAAIGLYMFVADAEFGAEVYSGATTEKQAWEVFRPARLMVDRTPALRGHYDIEVCAKNMHVLADGSRFEPLVGNPGDGSSPHCAIVDEYHEHDTDDLYQTMETGMGARTSPLMLVISTAGSNLAGPCKEMQADMERVLEGTVVDDSLFGMIFTCDEGDEWDSDEALLKANPNIDVSVSGEFLRRQRDQARRSATKQNHFRTKHLNQWVGARTAWMNMLAWQRQRSQFTLEDMGQAPCWMAVDLASKKDVAALVLLFERNGEYFVYPKFYAPESAADDNEKYRDFATGGHMTLTPGNMTDYAFIEEDIKALAGKVNLQDAAFDNWQANYLMTRLANTSIPVVDYNQTVKNMSDPMKEVEARTLSGVLHHDGNPVMTWMMGNVSAKIDAKENIYPRKDNDNDPRCKIDGVVALIMAMGRAIVQESGGTLDEFLADPVSV
jgi:phage terminase large subunit-like protein